MTPASDNEQMLSNEIRDRILELNLERYRAELSGLGTCTDYMNDLEDELADCRKAFVMASVSEIATLRRELSGPQKG